jgi:hypothetical protein
LVTASVCGSLFAVAVAEAQRERPVFKPTQDVVSAAKDLVGQTFWLRIDVLRFQYALAGGSDATNVFADKQVLYRSSAGGFTQSQSASASELANQLAKHNLSARILPKGSKVVVHGVGYERDGSFDIIAVNITEMAKTKSTIRFHFERGKCTAPLFADLLRIAFASSEAESSEPTVKIALGMTLEEVVKAKGAPKTQIDLGDKTVLQYEGLKFTFRNGKLESVE